MKLLIYLLLIIVCISTKSEIDEINSIPGIHWKAGETSVSHLSDEEFTKIFGFNEKLYNEMKSVANLLKGIKFDLNFNDLPDHFDARQKWPGCIHPILNQGSCGSCWAFASSQCLGDRFCIKTNGTIDVVLSPQYQVSCDKTALGCNGGSPNLVWRFLTNHGTTTIQCIPYISGNRYVPKCMTNCTNNQRMEMYKAANYYRVGSILNPRKYIHDIMKDIMYNGPVDATYVVYSDFKNYKSGVYHHVKGGIVALHSVRVIGWGIEDGVPYWLVANSWGTHWGLEGFFKIRRGVNECYFETLIYTGTPKL